MKNKGYIDLTVNFANIFIIIILLLFSYSEISSFNVVYKENWATRLTIMSILLLSYQIISLIIKRNRFTDFNILFIILTYIFLFGQIWVIGLGKEEAIFWGVIFRYDLRYLYEAGLYSLVYIQAVFIGLTLINYSKKYNGYKFYNSINKERLSNFVYKVGIILILISFLFRIYIDVYTIMITLSQGGYSGINLPVGPMNDLAMLAIPGIVFVLASKYKKRKVNFRILSFSTVYFCIVMMMSGDRRYYVTGLIAIFLTYISTYKIKLSIKNIIILLFLLISSLNLLTVIRDLRQYEILSIGKFMQAYFQQFLDLNPILETLSEFGLTFLSVVFAVKLVPEAIPYQLGLSIFGSIPTLLPIGWAFPDFFNKVSVGRTINHIEGYPVGTSITSELFANFGWWSIIFAIFIGLLLNSIFKIKRDNPFLIARYYSLFYILINIVRSSTIEVFRHTVIIIAVPSLILFYLYTKDKKITKISSSNDLKNERTIYNE